MAGWHCQAMNGIFKYMATSDQSRPILAMCPPEHFGVQYEINPWMEGNIGRADAARAREQWDVLHALLAAGGDEVALCQRAAEEIALQGLRRALQPHLALGGGKDDARGGAGLGLADDDMLARSHLGIAAFEAVEPDDVQPLVLGIGQQGAGGCGALSLDLDDVAFGNAQLAHRFARDAGDVAAGKSLSRLGQFGTAEI